MFQTLKNNQIGLEFVVHKHTLKKCIKNIMFILETLKPLSGHNHPVSSHLSHIAIKSTAHSCYKEGDAF